MLTATDIHKTFFKTEGKRKVSFSALDGVSLTAHDGETLGILGPNGAGKTTLLRILGSLMEPTSGRVACFDRDGAPIADRRTLRQRMGYLSDNTKLYRQFSIRELLAFFWEVYDLPPADRDSRIEGVITLLEMDAFADQRIAKLSTGQTQRASIARCLLHNPDTYIFDEPTLGLDIMSAAAIVDFMRREKQAGKTIIYSTHYMEEAQSLCDRVLLLNRGRIIASGSPSELMEVTGASGLRDAFLQLIGKDGGPSCG